MYCSRPVTSAYFRRLNEIKLIQNTILKIISNFVLAGITCNDIPNTYTSTKRGKTVLKRPCVYTCSVRIHPASDRNYYYILM